MDTYLTYSLVLVICYLVGSFPTGVVISKSRYGIDVRETGSGNIGATNVVRTFGWYAGFFTLLVDSLKGYIPLFIVDKYFPDSGFLLAASGISLVIGHCFSIYLKFCGGKGVATSFGCVFFIEPKLAIICAFVYLLIILKTRISAVGSLSVVFVATFYSFFSKMPINEKVLVYSLCGIILIRHYSNIRRLINTRKYSRNN